MPHDLSRDPRQLQPTPPALDAGATIQDAVVRRLRFVRAATADGPRPPRVVDHPPLLALLGRKR
jgi:hypothetical protein